MIDLAVAGGGPVGLAAALYAHQAGLDVEVYEPRAGSIDKACGEGLMPGAVAALAGLGVDPDGQPMRGIAYLDGRRSATADFANGPGRGVRRTTLHSALRTAVLAAGVPIRAERIEGVTQDAASVRYNDTRARHLMAADGLHSPVRHALGLDVATGAQRRFGLRCHVQLAPWTDRVEVHWADGVEAYVTPVAPDLIGIALLTERRAGFAEQLSRFPALRSRIDGASTTSVRGAGPLRQRSARRVAGRVLLVGDASGYVDALTGEGIALGLAQARAAVAAIAGGRAGSYERTWQLLSWRYRLLTAGLLQASRIGPIRRRIVPAAATLPWVFGRAVNELARPL